MGFERTQANQWNQSVKKFGRDEDQHTIQSDLLLKKCVFDVPTQYYSTVFYQDYGH